jgi:hypothetical protein
MSEFQASRARLRLEEILELFAAAIILVSLVAVSSFGCGDRPASPSQQHDLTGRWGGFAQISTTGLATPLEMMLVDDDGILTGTGGGVDCRYFLTCGSFYSYTVTGSHDSSSVRIDGTTPEGRTWTLRGSIDAGGTRMEGIATSQDFPASPWQMSRQP